MSQIIVKTNSKSNLWTQNRRYKVGQPTIHNGQNWVNITGANSEPGVGSDWLFISSTSSVLISDKEFFTATAAQTDFILSNTPSSVDVMVDRVSQLDTIDYNLVGDTVIMTDGLDVGSKVEIRKF